MEMYKSKILFRIKIFIIFSGSIFINSCIRNQTSDYVIINPDLFTSQQFSLSYVSDSIMYIPLSSEILFNGILHLEISNENIYISTSEGVLKYDLFGKFIQKIGQKGQGPEEYLSCNNFTIDRFNQKIYILTSPYIKVFSFDGIYLNEDILCNEINPVKIKYMDGQLYLFPLIITSKSKTPYLWGVIDVMKNTLIKKENMNILFKGEGLTYFGNFVFNRNSYLVYWNHYMDTIFEISNNEIQANYIWKHGGYRLTPDKVISEDDQQCLIPRMIFESDNFLYINYLQYGEKFVCLYDRSLKKFIKTKIVDGINNDLDGGLPFLPQYYIQTNKKNEYFIQSLYPSEIKEYVNNNNLQQSKSTFAEFANSLDNDDNQILVIVKLK